MEYKFYPTPAAVVVSSGDEDDPTCAAILARIVDEVSCDGGYGRRLYIDFGSNQEVPRDQIVSIHTTLEEAWPAAVRTAAVRARIQAL